MKPNLIPLLFLVVISLFSCQRELSELPPIVPPVPEVPDTIATDPPPAPPAVVDNKIVANVQGRVLDENGSPMYGATVTAGTKTTTTGEFGIFTLNDVILSELSSFIKADKPGYFTGSRTIVSEPGGNGFVQIKMLPKKSAGSFNTSSGGEVNVEGKALIKIPAGSIITSSGDTYSGTVKVFATFLDPDAADFVDIMPGDLRGLNADSQAVALKSYGMLNVTLQSTGGQELQIAAGKKSDIMMKVPASMAGKAPAEIPLWHFSESDGKWREDGKARLENGWYIGSVSHFSTWNVDIPANFVLITLKVRGEKGTRRSYTRVKFTNAEGLYSEGFTDSAGYIKTWVPKGSPLKLEVLTDCGDVLHEHPIGPFTDDTDIGEVTVESRQMVSVYGTVTGCEDEPVNRGYAVMHLRGLNYSADVVNGEFYFYISKCINESAGAEIFVTDPYRTHQTASTTIQVGSQNVSAGNFKACELGSFEYVAYSLGADTVMIETPPATVDYSAFIGDTATRITFHWGIHDIGFSDITVEFYDTVVHTSTVINPVTMLDHSDTLVAVAPLIVDVKKIGRVGLFMHLTFAGRYRNTHTNQEVPLAGEMWIKRRK
jgi:hypothetical protein